MDNGFFFLLAIFTGRQLQKLVDTLYEECGQITAQISRSVGDHLAGRNTENLYSVALDLGVYDGADGRFEDMDEFGLGQMRHNICQEIDS